MAKISIRRDPVWTGKVFKLCKPAVFHDDKPVFMLKPLDGSSGCTANFCCSQDEAIRRAIAADGEF